MSIIQKFYDNMASHYDKLFLDWKATTKEQAVLLQGIFQKFNFGQTASILDCACGIGTQAIGLALLGYDVTASDISDGEIAEAKARAANKVNNTFFITYRILILLQIHFKVNFKIASNNFQFTLK